jgi:coenzyme F420 hydrogenase subunit beta
LLGQLISCYRGHASDYDLRWKATSGGTITALLKLAFEIGMIDTAIVTGPDPSDPVVTRPFVARSFEEVLLACGSRYAPSPVNRCLGEAMKSDRIAVVGLPCHFESLRKAEAIHKELRQKTVLRLGLFCSHNMSLLATEFVYRHFHVPRAKITSFKYRGNGWPGSIRIETVDGQELIMPRQDSLWARMFMAFIFAAPYCLLCTDHTSEFADVSFGDAWLPEIMEKDNVGESIIIVRSPMGERLVKQGMERGDLQISELSAEKVIESQPWPLYFKKRLVHGTRDMLAEKRFDVSNRDSAPLSFTKVERWLIRRAWLNAVSSCHPFMPALLSRIPLRCMIAYSRHYHNRLWNKYTAWLRGRREG